MSWLDTRTLERSPHRRGPKLRWLLSALLVSQATLVHHAAWASDASGLGGRSEGSSDAAPIAESVDDRPNIILMVSDDYGWPYYGFMIDRLRSTLHGRNTGPCDVSKAPCSPACRDDFYPGQIPSPMCSQPFDPSTELDVATKNLDALAATGIAFEHGYVADSACTPAYRALLSGLNLRDLDLARERKLGCEYGGPQTIPEALAQAGYNTLLAGKSWLVNPTRFFNDRVCDATSCTTTDPGIRSTESPTVGEDVPLDLLKRFIKAQDARAKTQAEGRRPWFVMWSPLSPHYSYNNIPAHIRGMYDHVEVRNPPYITSNNFGDTSFRSYLEAITYYDERVGELVEFLDLLESVDCDPDPLHDASRALDELPTPAKCASKVGNPARYAGFRRNTLIVYLTDNPAGVQNSKAHFSENGLRTPVIVNYPARIPPTGTHEALVGAIDVLPTILDYARRPGTPLRVFPDAMSLRSLAEDPSTYPTGWRRYMFSNPTTDGWLSVVDSLPATYKDHGPRRGRIKLYSTKGVGPAYSAIKRVSDVENDPFEVLSTARPPTLITAASSCLVRYGVEAGAELRDKSTVQHLRGVLRAWDGCSVACRQWLVQAKLSDEACGRAPQDPPPGCSAASTLCKDPNPSGFSPIDCS